MRLFVYGSLMIPTEMKKFHNYRRNTPKRHVLSCARRVFARKPNKNSPDTVLDLELNCPGSKVPGIVLEVTDDHKMKSLKRRESGYNLVKVDTDLFTFVTPKRVGLRDGRRRIKTSYLKKLIKGLGSERKVSEFMRTTWHRGSYLED